MQFGKLAIVGWALVVATGTTLACSSESSAPAAVDEDDDSGAPRDESDSTAPGPASPAPPTDSGVVETGTPIQDADVGDGNAGVLCQAGDTKETENNDSAATADMLSGIPSIYCGRLTPGDSDFVTFTLDTPNFKTVYNFSSAPITMTATVDGQTFDLAGSSYVYEQGKSYVIEITAAAATDYRLQLEPL